MHQEQLQQILTVHKLWVTSGGTRGWRAHLQGAHLRYAHLQGAHLQGAHLQWAHLQGAHLGGANLRLADLRGAHLQEAHLGGANLEEADLRGADLQGADLRQAKFTLEIRECNSFEGAQVSEDGIPWLVLHPRFGEWMKGLEVEQ